MAAAIGAGLPIHEPTGNMVVDIGGGTTEVAVISLGGIVVSQSIRIGGDELDEAIISFVKKEYSLALGERTAEEIKIALGSAYELEEELHAEIRGRDLVTGLPKTVVTTTEEIRKAIEEPVAAIVDAVKVTLDKTPPELAADIMDQGIVLTGGGALLHGLDSRLQAETHMPIVVAPDPAQLRRARQWHVPRGVRGPQAGPHLLDQPLTFGVAVATSRRNTSQRLTLVILLLASITVITIAYRGEARHASARSATGREMPSHRSSGASRPSSTRSATSSPGWSTTAGRWARTSGSSSRSASSAASSSRRSRPSSSSTSCDRTRTFLLRTGSPRCWREVISSPVVQLRPHDRDRPRHLERRRCRDARRVRSPGWSARSISAGSTRRSSSC